MHRRGAAILLVLIAFLFASAPVQAYYVPADLQAEAQVAAKGGNPGLYSFVMKYYDGTAVQGWQYSMLRGIAMEETNNGKISPDLHVVMKLKYGK